MLNVKDVLDAVVEEWRELIRLNPALEAVRDGFIARLVCHFPAECRDEAIRELPGIFGIPTAATPVSVDPIEATSSDPVVGKRVSKKQRLRELLLGRQGQLVTRDEVRKLIYDGAPVSKGTLVSVFHQLRNEDAVPLDILTVRGQGWICRGPL